MVAFLEDFLKYYNKGPNFARDALATGIVNITTGNNVAPTQVIPYDNETILKPKSGYQSLFFSRIANLFK